MNSILQDIRFALRGFRNKPGFAIFTLVTLAIGIGANTAIFSVVHAVLLERLPYKDPQRLVKVHARFLPASGYDFPQFSLSVPEYFDYKNQSESIDHAAAYRTPSVNLTGDGAPERVPSARVTGNFFSVMGSEALLGRTFTPDDDPPGGKPLAILSHSLWTQRYGASAEIRGSKILLDGRPYEVIGVMPEGFRFPSSGVRLWTPLGLDPADDQRGSHSLDVVARLKAGTSLEAASAEMPVLMAGWGEDHPEHHGPGGSDHFLFLRSLRDDLTRSIRPALWTLFGAVGLVLVIGCANIASLLLVRGEARAKEIALRAAMGAGRVRLVRQFLTESLLLSAAGGLLGVLLASWMINGLLVLYPGTIPQAGQVEVNLAVLLFTFGVSIVAGVLFGVAPAFQGASIRLHDTLKTAGRGVRGGMPSARLHRALVVAEIALSLTLLVGAGLLVQSFLKLRLVDTGFDARNVLTMDLLVPKGRYSDLAEARRFFTRLLDRLRSLPGVQSAATISHLPLRSRGAHNDFRIEGRPKPAPGETAYNADYRMVSAGFFKTLRVPLIRGRFFTDSDVRGVPWVALINQATQRKFWPKEDPIGKRIHYLDDDDAPRLTIVGVVGDIRADHLDSEPRPAIYVPHAQAPEPGYSGRFMTLVVRGPESWQDPAGQLRETVWALDPNLPVSSVMTMEEVVERASANPRFTTLLMSLFAVTALLLAAIGIYGLMFYSVTQQTQEFGIRMALGAKATDVLRMVLSRGLRPALLGVGLGVAAALGLSRVLRQMLFEVEPNDLLTFVGVSAILIAVAASACYLPARRAAKVDPMTALRYE